MSKDKAILVGVGLKSESFKDLKESLFELEELIHTAGGEVAGVFTQQVEKFSPATLMGSGKIEQIKQAVEDTDADLVVIDHGLTGVQSRNLEKILDVAVLDRSQVILDIFAQRAQSYEGQLQVTLAQMLDQLPRMVGGWMGSLSRLAGGIGTRGPGESALEMDRRRIHKRIDVIKKKLEVVRKNRAQHRQKRQKKSIPSFALIGYTNAGKSTLLNRLTHSDVYEKDELFATLDPTTRQLYLKGIGDAVITDTVGFIRNLPTKLIEAFKATLEESTEADILLHVIDLSSETLEAQVKTVEDLISEFGWEEKPIVYVYNKLDASLMDNKFKVNHPKKVLVSAKTGAGIDQLKKMMTDEILAMTTEVELFFNSQMEHKFYDLSRVCKISKKESSPSGTFCVAQLTQKQISEWSGYKA
ncbi:MAG: GTPase HflX [Bdellovibrionaceae bacterium]|jgi:GTPase|nr:GTPase HflX [Pseudobdellovibrionaceae bacterium]